MRDEILNPSEIRLPDSVAGCRERIKTLQDEIASIRIQIATTDIRRQVEKKTSDPALFHRSKTAMRLKQQELKLIQTLNKSSPSNVKASQSYHPHVMLQATNSLGQRRATI